MSPELYLWIPLFAAFCAWAYWPRFVAWYARRNPPPIKEPRGHCNHTRPKPYDQDCESCY